MSHATNPPAPSRREFLRHGALAASAFALPRAGSEPHLPLRPRAPRAKSLIYLHMEGAPPTLDMFDRKPELDRLAGQTCPAEFLAGERFAFIKGVPKLLGHPHGWIGAANGIEVCELLPHLAQQLGDATLVRSMVTDQFNHAPAEHLLFSGAARPGRPSLGAWLSFGLASENRDLPAFVVMLSGGSLPSAGRALWGAGFLPSVHQGCEFRAQGDPVLYLQDPAGYDRARRERVLGALVDLDQWHLECAGDPETATRIAQYQLAFRMQQSVPEAVDLASEPAEVHALYGTTPGRASLANNCLLARRLVERGVRCVHLFDSGWDIHGTGPGDDLMTQFPKKAAELDRALAGLLVDLRRRGLLEETLVVWGGEFGRTPMNEARDGSKFLGRDHHPHCFSVLLAGGGVPRGKVVGATDAIGYRVTEAPIHVHDLQATILHLLGIDHERLVYRFQGRDFRLTDVAGLVRRELLA
ncbi:MAG: DUF1501 domain-containing protein [Planctomycetes bacterium]|nr:DUF1501 domain-containing protein [Planctomycetota bacterium]